MTEYRFRGYDTAGRKGWVYGDLVHNKKILVRKPFLADRMMVGGYEVYPESVGLCSGVSDRNGRKIFVGDVLRVFFRFGCHARLYDIVFVDGVVGLNFSYGFVSVSFLANQSDEYSLEVVGTVFERDLLNDK